MAVQKRIQKGKTTFVVRWDEEGRQRSRSFRLKRDATAFELEVTRARQLGPLAATHLTTRGPTLNEWIAQRWRPEHGVLLSKSTRARYAHVYELHIQPELGEVPITKIDVAKVRAWQASLTADQVGAGTIDKARTFLSSVLRHAAESRAIPANPVTLVRAPRHEHKDSVQPLAPATVENLRRVLAGAMDVTVPERTTNGRKASSYVIADQRDQTTRVTDAAIVSLLAYAGLRAGELRGLRWGDIRDNTITVERAADEDGQIKSTKTRERRAVRLLTPLAQDLNELRLALGRPTDEMPILNREQRPWTKTDWQVWRAKRWAKACKLAGLTPAPRPYDLRHSFASLLLAEGRSVHYVAQQLGHAPTLTLNTYGHLFAEYEDTARIDAEAEIRDARSPALSLRSRDTQTDATTP